MNLLVELVFRKITFTLIALLVVTSVWTQEITVKRALAYSKTDTMRCFLLNQIIEEETNHYVWNPHNKLLLNTVNYALKTLQPTDSKYKTFQKYQAIAFLNQGAYYHYTDAYSKAIAWYKKSLVCAKRINFHEQSASCLQNIGSAFDYLGKLDSSLVYFKKALIYAKKSKNNSNIAYVLTDLGFVYNNLGHIQKAIDYNIQALRLFQNLKDDEGIERTYTA